MIELKDKEIEFYKRILYDFSSKVGNLETICPDSIDFSLFINQNYKVRYGITKIVLIPKNRGARYVLKLPILRPRGNRGLEDWCQVELNAYEEAYKAEYSDLFSEIDYFINYGGYQTYIQERVGTSAEFKDDALDCASYSSLYEIGFSEMSLDNAEINNICAPLLEDLTEYWNNDIEKVENFISFLTEHHINDLHTSNFGYTKEGSPIIFDYSGFGNCARLYRGI